MVSATSLALHDKPICQSLRKAAHLANDSPVLRAPIRVSSILLVGLMIVGGAAFVLRHR